MDGFRLFAPTRIASFLSRPNRFLVRCEMDGHTVDAFLPNPGRLMELLLPGSRLHLIREERGDSRKTACTVVAVERDGLPVMVHTQRTNHVASYFLRQEKIPGLEGARLHRSEVRLGPSRFDFLLEKGDERVYLEVKSCTLFGDRVAMFPDAVTERGTRHLRELASLCRDGARGAVLFMVHCPRVRIFMPDYHTDLTFSETLLRIRREVQIIPLALRWNPDLSLHEDPVLLHVPWDHIETEAKDRGSYLLILHLRKGTDLSIGKLGAISFPAGFYVYVGSAMAGLTSRMERHRRLRKRPHWHIDFLRAAAEFRSLLPIRASTRLECDIAKSVHEIGQWHISGFGSTDCGCPSHLIGMTGDPLCRHEFHRLIQYFRMDRYETSTNSDHS